MQMRNKTSGSIEVFERLIETLRKACETQHRPIAELAVTSLTQLRATLEGHGDIEPVITIPLLGSIRLRKNASAKTAGNRDEDSTTRSVETIEERGQIVDRPGHALTTTEQFDDLALPPSSMFDTELILGPYADLDNIWEMFDMM